MLFNFVYSTNYDIYLSIITTLIKIEKNFYLEVKSIISRSYDTQPMLISHIYFINFH